MKYVYGVEVSTPLDFYAHFLLGMFLIQIDNSIFMLSHQPGFCLRFIEDYFP